MLSDIQLNELAQRVPKILRQAGLAYTTGAGNVIEVPVKNIIRAGDQYVGVEVDLRALPPTVQPKQLKNADVLKKLSEAFEHPVRVLNGSGLTYVVEMHKPLPMPEFPEHVMLPVEAPAGLVYPWPFGVTAGGRELWCDLLETDSHHPHTGHILVGGQTGYGKSTFIHAGLVALLRRHGPKSLQLAMIDMKLVELAAYRSLPHLCQPLAATAEAAQQVVTATVKELERRKQLFAAAGTKKLRQYNARNTTPLPLMVLVIDELKSLVDEWGGVKSEKFKQLVKLSGEGRAFGIVLVLATQHPRADVIDTPVRNNCDTRVACHVSSSEQSQCILEHGGAEKLPAQKGRWLAKIAGAAELQELQGFDVLDRDVTATVARWIDPTKAQLNPEQVLLVEYAVQKLDGYFIINKLAVAFGEGNPDGRPYLSKARIDKQARELEQLGLLTAPDPHRVTVGRMVTPELVKVLKASPKQKIL